MEKLATTMFWGSPLRPLARKYPKTMIGVGCVLLVVQIVSIKRLFEKLEANTYDQFFRDLEVNGETTTIVG